MDTRSLKKALSGPLTRAGFSRKGDTWFIQSPEVVAVVNLQRSSYSASYFLNLAFWLKVVGVPPVVPPPEYKCHVQFRAGGSPVDVRRELDELLASSPLDDDERNRRLESAVTDVVVPFMKVGLTVLGLQSLLREGTLPDSSMTLVARSVLQGT